LAEFAAGDRDICAGLPEDEKKRILGGNAAEFFRLT
jgi:predicted TIM-barrel fold metal-dependent hydrolase